MSSDDQRQIQLDLLAEEFISRQRRGDHPSADEYAAAHPDLAGDIQSLFPLLTAMETSKIDPGAEDLAAGTQVGDCTLLRVIGRGGMGVVYEAEEKTLGRRVALKVLPHMAHLDPRTVERFRVEAQAAARLKHPRIVPLIGYGQHGDIHFYTMQYIEGRGLDEVIAEAGDSASPGAAHYRRSARIVLQAADGIAHAHAHGVLHRDVKPSNLLLDSDGSVWITDFGLCKLDDAEDITRTGDVLGTFRYMAPERFHGESDVRSDIYGLGITLYELLTRQRAYEENDRAALAAHIASEPPPRPRARDSAIPLDLETIVRKATAHDPAQRYATVEALIVDLRAFLDGRPIAARAPSLGYVMRRAIARHRALSLTLALATLLLIGTTTWYVVGLRKKEQQSRFRHYAATIAAVESAVVARAGFRAADLLAEAPVELRHWEWRYLKSRLDPSLRSFPSLPKRVEDVVYHPAGTWFAATLGREVWVYSDASGEVVQKLEAGATVRHLAWSPRGDRLAMGTVHAVELWSWPDPQRLHTSEPLASSHVGFVRRGSEVIAASTNGDLVRLDAQGASVSRTRLESGVLSLACDSADTTARIALATEDGRVRVLDGADWAEVWSRRVSTHDLQSVAFLDGQRVACTTSGLVRIWSASDGEEVRTLAVGGKAERIIEDPTRKRLLVFGRRRLLVFDASEGNHLRSLTGESIPSRAAVHPDGRRIVVGSASGQIREWYLGDGSDPLTLARHMDDAVALDVAPSGLFAASGGFGGVVRLWDLQHAQLARVFFGNRGAVGGVHFSPDGTRLATSDSHGQVVLRQLPSGRLLHRWSAHKGNARRVRFTPDGRRLLSLGEGDRMLRAWDTQTAQLLGEVVCDAAPSSLAVSPDGELIATGDAGGNIQLRAPTSLAVLRTLRGHEKSVSGVAFHPRKPLLASASEDQTLRLWSTGSGEPLRASGTPDPNLAWDAGLSAVAFSPDGARIATGSYSGTLRIWDTAGARLLASLEQGSWVSEIAFSGDGTRVLASLTDGTIRVSDSVPLRKRVPAIERAAKLQERARRLLAEMAVEEGDPEQLLRALATRVDLAEDIREAAVRAVHKRRGSHEGLVARMWRDLTPPDAPAERQMTALALATGLWRATRHRGRGGEDPRCDTLRGVAHFRAGQPKRTLEVFDRIGARNEQRAPELYAVDLAFAAMSHAALEDAESAKAHLTKLEALLGEQPDLATPRVLGFLGEARALVDK